MLSVIIATKDSERALVTTLAALVSGATAGIISEVLNLSGVNAGNYALDMSYSATALEALQSGGTSNAGIFIAELESGVWTDICSGSNLGLYNSAYTTPGEWGINPDNTVWVVVPSATTSGSFAVVPEPGTMALLAVALLSLIAYAWRKRKN